MTEAKKLLTHYFRILFEKAGFTWDSDNQVEVEEIVNLIVEAAKPSKAELIEMLADLPR